MKSDDKVTVVFIVAMATMFIVACLADVWSK